MAEPEPVPVRDLEVADRIARAVRGGKPADRTPTIEQLVAAFGEAEPTLDARRRAARALALAGVAAVPDVLEAAPGQRITLEVRHVRKRGALVAGILALVLLFAAVAAAATQLDFSDDNAASSLPADSTATGPTTATNTVTQEPTSSATTATGTTATGTTATGTTAAPTTSTAVPATASARRRAKRQRERRGRHSGVQHDRHRAVVDERHPHARTEDPACDRNALVLERNAEALVERLRLGRRGSVGEAGARSLARVGDERELADDERLAADVDE